ncbi:DUF411 domain-containing protein [Tepidamorphus sp. 3E244]|uniref:DUF411 domain-containing protein n=1 Tax=Tepidamorphus sp. 3E244 TaxID=3385498 RepID=UPI0038FC3963
MTMTRRTLVTGLAVTALASTVPFRFVAAQSTPVVTVEKSATCGCCIAWIEHLEENGFTVEAKNVSSGALTQSKMAAGLKPEHFSCHTAKVDGYVVEGHVPAADIRKLLAERPDAAGLSVPEMPIGSPGMDFGDDREPYDVLLIARDGSASVFSSYNR